MNFQDFHFIRPYWLLALIPVILAAIWILRRQLKHGQWSQVCDPELLPYILQNKPKKSHQGSFIALLLAFVLAVFALAGPAWQRLPVPVFRNDAALVIALNLSVTMNAADIKPSRLIRARYKIADILKQRKDGQTALLVYAGDAFTVTPLTDDTETILSQLNALNTDIMPSRGRDTAAALRLAGNLLKQAGMQKGDILLVTDAVEKPVLESIPKLVKPYRLSVLGVGTPDGAPIKAPQGGFVKDRQGNIIVARLDSQTLSAVAKKGRGEFQLIRPDDSDIKNLLGFFDRAARSAKQQDSNMKLEQWRDEGPYLLWLVVPLAALAFRKGLLCLALVLLLPFPQDSYAFDGRQFWQNLWKTPDQQAQEAFKQQQFERSAELFKSPEWKASAEYKAGHYEQAAKIWQQMQSAEAYYNLGNALAKSGKLEPAIKAYEQALTLKPDFEDARYNKELLEKQLQKQKQQQQQNSQSKQDQQNQDSQESSDNKQQQSSNNSQQNQKSGSEQNNQQQQSDESDSEADAEKNESSQEKTESQAQQTEASEDKQGQQQQSQPVKARELSDEDQQAIEQWLHRIPDDPSGLLKRKFRYQYRQRQNRK